MPGSNESGIFLMHPAALIQASPVGDSQGLSLAFRALSRLSCVPFGYPAELSEEIICLRVQLEAGD